MPHCFCGHSWFFFRLGFGEFIQVAGAAGRAVRHHQILGVVDFFFTDTAVTIDTADLIERLALFQETLFDQVAFHFGQLLLFVGAHIAVRQVSNRGKITVDAVFPGMECARRGGFMASGAGSAAKFALNGFGRLVEILRIPVFLDWNRLPIGGVRSLAGVRVIIILLELFKIGFVRAGNPDAAEPH